MAFAVTHDFTAGENAIASEVNQNFTDIETELNAFPTDGTLSDGAVSTTAKLANSIITTAKFTSTAFYDTDAMTEDSATACASQQSIKAHVATEIGTVDRTPAGPTSKTVAEDTDYQVSTTKDAFLYIKGGYNASIDVFLGSTTAPTVSVGYGYSANNYGSVCIYVPKGWYFRVESSLAVAITAYYVTLD